MTSPNETLTFLYTDIEGSTRLWQRHRQAMPGVIARHDALLREVVTAHGGAVFRTMGDAVCAVFRTGTDAVQAALDGQRAIRAERWAEGIDLRVRMAIHTGSAEQRDGDYAGHTLNRVARLVAAGHGGQILVSGITRDLILDELPVEIVLRDLGVHQLRDLERPEHIFQVQVDGVLPEFPPLRTVRSTATNLPGQTTSFVGREVEAEQISTMLQDEKIRLVSLLGPGGTGKTRLALHTGARLLEEYRNGVFYVPLAPITDPLLVAPAIADALGIRETEDKSIDQRLAEHLRDSHMLLILDNFEQVADAAPLIADLLASAPQLTVLITSRTVLHLAAEHEFHVPPLAVPDPARHYDAESLGQYDAVALFIQRAQAINRDFTVTSANAPAVAEICYRLDGLPLAIELAAARIRLFPPEALLRLLTRSLSVLTGGARDLPARQRTLRGTIDWSYSLLSAEEQLLFSRLAVFVGGCTLDAAEEVCNLEGDLNVLGGLASLVEQSLLRQEGVEEPRFTMLETVREYALEQLEASGATDDLRGRHAAWYAELLRNAPDLVTDLAAVVYALPFLFAERDNLRAVLRWHLDRRDWAGFTTLLRPLSVFWFAQGQWTEALSWTEGVLPTMPDSRTSARASLLFVAGFFLFRVGKYEKAATLLEESVGILRELDQVRELSTALYMLGELTATRGQGARARPIIEEALAVANQVENDKTAPMALTFLGILSREQGDYAGAHQYMEKALDVASRLGHESYSAIALNGLGDLARIQGHDDAAESFYLRSAELSTQIGLVFPRAGLLHNRAYIAHHRGDDEAARAGFKEALDLFRELGDPRGVAECVAGMAVLDAEGHPQRAARLLAAAFSTAESMGTRLSSSNQTEYDAAMAVIHAHLDGADFQSAWAEGRAMSLDDAVAYAVGPEQSTVHADNGTASHFAG
jgi:predicted ATPase/class 3 adenylate cyclase